MERVETMEEADFILNSGPWGHEETLAHHADRPALGVARGLPMVCANPDRW